MKNINNIKLNNIFSGLGILAILALGIVLMPSTSFARTYGTTCGEGGCNYNYNTSLGQGTVTSPDQSTVIHSNPVVVNTTPTIYSNSTGPKVVTAQAPKTVTKAVATAKQPILCNPATTTPTQEFGNLSANALFGSNGFLPSGLIQWILLAILILLIVILVRKVSGAEDKYHSEPLKHA